MEKNKLIHQEVLLFLIADVVNEVVGKIRPLMEVPFAFLLVKDGCDYSEERMQK